MASRLSPRPILIAMAALWLSGRAVSAQMTVTWHTDNGHTAEDQGNSPEPHDYDYDFVNELESPNYSGTVWYQSISAIDTRYFDTTTPREIHHRYRYTVAISAPGKCWELRVTSARRGQVGAWHDNRGHAHAEISSLSGSTNNGPYPGLSLPGSFAASNHHDEDEHDVVDVDDVPAVALFSGSGSQTFDLIYSWDASLTSTVCGPEDGCVFNPQGGDEAIVEMGLNVNLDDSGNDSIDNGRVPHPGWGHRVHLELTTTEPPVLIETCPPPPDVACVGLPASLSVVASGEDLLYTWTRDGLHVDSGPELSTLTLDPVTFADEGWYVCTISNDCGSVATCPVFLDVEAAPEGGIDEVTPAQPMCVGDDLEISLLTTIGDFDYRWQFRAPGSTTWQNRTSNPLYHDNNVTLADSGDYRVLISNDCGTITGGPVTVTVIAPPVIVGGLTNGPPRVCANEDLSLVANLTGSPPFTYTWFHFGVPIPNASGVTSDSTIGYTVTDASINSGGVYRIEVSNHCGMAAKNTNVDVFLPITVTGSLTQTFCPEEPIRLEVQASTADHGDEFLFQWYDPYQNLVRTTTGTSSFLLRPAIAANEGEYCVVVSHATVLEPACPSVTVCGTVTVLDPPLVTLTAAPDPAFLALCGAPEVTLSASVSQASEPITYQWFKDGVLDPAGPNAATYHLGSVFEPVSYYVRATSADGCRGQSAPVTLAADQTGEDAQWIGQHGASLLTYGSWQRLEDEEPLWSSACGSWQESALGTSGVCPPTRFARIENSSTSSRIARLAAGEIWGLEQLEIEGNPSTASWQMLSVEPAARLGVDVCATLKPHGLLYLDGGGVDAGLFTVKSGGRLEGSGQLVASGEFHNHGNVMTGAAGYSHLDLVCANGLQNHPAATLRVPRVTSMQVTGDLRNGIETVPSGLVHVEDNARLSVTGVVENDGLVKIALPPAAPGSNLTFGSVFTNRGGVAIAPGNTQLSAGLWLQGGRIAGTLLENRAGARTHGYGVIDSSVLNEGLTRVTRPAGNILTVLGCFDNRGTVRIDAGTTLVLANQGSCPSAGMWSFEGTGECVGCPTLRVAEDEARATLVIHGGFENGDGAQLDLRDGLVQVFGAFRSEISDPYGFDLSGTRVEIGGDGMGGAGELSLAAPDLGSLGDFGARRAMALAELVIGPAPSVVVLPAQPDGSASTLYVQHLSVSAGATLDLGETQVYAQEVTLEPGATVSLSAGQLAYGSINLPDPCGSGQVVGGDCAAQLAPMPAPDCDGDGTPDAAEIAAGTAADCNGNGVPDACDLSLGGSLDQDDDTVPDECELLHVDRPWISASHGGRQELSLHAGPAHARRSYVLTGWLGSNSGVGGFGHASTNPPQQVLGRTTLRILASGFLDPEGNASTALQFEPGQLSASLIGLDFRHAYTVLHGRRMVASSNVVALEIRP